MADTSPDAQSLFRSGHLEEALERQTALVRKKPIDSDARYQLFVLLCFAGELERADKQLAVLAGDDERAASGSLVLHSLLSAEWERRQVFEKEGRPTLPPDAPDWAAQRADALEQLRAGDEAGAGATLDAADEAAPLQPGTLNGEAFDDWRDYDDLLGGIVEVLAGGRYIWAPASGITRITCEAPTTALDTLWLPAKLEDGRGQVSDVHLPVLYAASYSHDLEAVRLGHLTEWIERGEFFTGVGQHLYATTLGEDTTERSILDCRELSFGTAG